jgi:hypothetical protein
MERGHFTQLSSLSIVTYFNSALGEPEIRGHSIVDLSTELILPEVK